MTTQKQYRNLLREFEEFGEGVGCAYAILLDGDPDPERASSARKDLRRALEIINRAHRELHQAKRNPERLSCPLDGTHREP